MSPGRDQRGRDESARSSARSGARWLITLSAALVLHVGAPRGAWGQAGLLVEDDDGGTGRLALVEMEVDVRIDHFHADVSVRQIFENVTDDSVRARYELALGRGAEVSGFALWDGAERQEAVVVERQRGRRLFGQLVRSGWMPGLLETVDRGARRDVYAVRVAPIPPRERVRVEVEYSQELEISADEAHFVFPFSARDRAAQPIGHLLVRLRVEGPWPLERVTIHPREGFRIDGPEVVGRGAFRAVLDSRDVIPSEDLQLDLRLAHAGGGIGRPVLLAYRQPEGHEDRSAYGRGRRYLDDRGYFVLRAPIQLDDSDQGEPGPSDMVIALDTSLSMRGAKLERAVEAIEGLLTGLPPTTRFTLLTFDEAVRRLPGGLAPATEARRAEARRFLRESWLAGGTDLRQAVRAALDALAGSSAPRRQVVLVTDGQPTLGTVVKREILRVAEVQGEHRDGTAPSFFVVGVGDDANHALLERLARGSGGTYLPVGEGAALRPLLRGLVHDLSAARIEELRATFDGVSGVGDLYPAEDVGARDGSLYVLWGRYSTPARRVRVTIRGRLHERPVERIVTGALPRIASERRWVARGWARRRVADLLARIEDQGERADWVGEIVALAREHLLVTPYTSLLAAARSALRPREITPGDPVLRVRTDPTDRAVTAMFSFGLVKSLRRLEPGLFETRFLAPFGLADGRYPVSLVITGHDGRTRLVRESFVIDSRPPRPRIVPPRGPLRAGEPVELRVRSDRDTRHLRAWLRPADDEGGPVDGPFDLRWSDEALACTGMVEVSPDLPAGRYLLVVTAEDHAHNVGEASVPVEVVGP